MGSALLAVVCLVGAGRGLYDNLYFHKIAGLAARIETGSAINPEAVSQLATMPALAAADRSCATVRAAVTLRLAAIDATPRGQNVLNDDAVLDAALGAIELALRCFPLDGNLWLRSAMLSLATSGPGDDVAFALAMSSWTAPGEAWVLRQRLPFSAILHDAGVQSHHEGFIADINRGGRHLPLDELERLYRAAGKPTRVLYREAMLFVAPAHRERIAPRFDAADGDQP